MSNVLGNLKPQLLWKHFEALCGIPHPSRHEQKISEYVISVAKRNNLKYNVDDFGNIVIKKSASPGFEKLKTVVLQGHLDMVPEKNSDVKHDFEKDPITPYIDGDWVRAKGTTLGSDNGIGVAASLAVLESKDLQLGPIEALYTLDEETGLFGAQALKPGFLEAEILLNLDSEEDGALYIGCAGGQNTFANFVFKLGEAPKDTVAIEIKITGLKGGHSGLDIQMGKGNAVKICGRLLSGINSKFGLNLVSINGGSKHNAIPRECFAVIRVKKSKEEEVKNYIANYNSVVKSEYATVEPTLKVAVDSVKSRAKVIDKTTSNNLINALCGIPHGVLKMSADIEGLVETSTNLATIKTEKKFVSIITSQRSSVESEKHDATNTVSSVLKLAKAEINISDGYPGWKPDIHSPILGVMKENYKKLYKSEPEVKAIHAGLECGIIKERYPDMDMISFGPTIMGAHSPDERVQISTVEKFWNLLIHSLQNAPKK